MHKISVIIPVYNAKASINNCIDSILNQTYKEFEIILVNDGSTDNSLDICKTYASMDSRIIVVDKKNGGVSSARNKGIESSTGEFIIFVDSDDYIETNMLERIYQYIDYDLTIFGYMILYGDKKIIKKLNFNKHLNIKEFGKDFSDLYFDNFINSPCNKMYKRNLITDLFPEDTSMGEDLLFNLKYLEKCKSIVCIEDVLYDYLITKSDSLSNKYTDNLFDNSIFLFNNIIEFCKKNFDNYNVNKINGKLIEDCFSIIQKMINCNRYSKNDIIAKMRDIRGNTSVSSALVNNIIDNSQYKAFVILIKHNKYKTLYNLFRLKKLLKGIK